MKLIEKKSPNQISTTEIIIAIQKEIRPCRYKKKACITHKKETKEANE